MARNTEGEPVFCDNCPGKGDYPGSPDPKDFNLAVEVVPQGDTDEEHSAEDGSYTVEVLGYFAQQPEDDMVPLTTDAEGHNALLSDSGLAYVYTDLAGYGDDGPSRELQVGERMCQYVGGCTGMQVVNGKPTCPGLNTAALDRAATFVFVQPFEAPVEGL